MNKTTFLGRRFLLLAGLLVGFAFRLYRLGAESLWYDETVSVYLARKPVAEMLAHTARDIHPPGYYLLLHFWQRLTAPSLVHGLEFLFAWPSLMAGVLVMALTFALVRRLFDAPTALISLWLAAFNPFQIWYSQEVRMYTVGAALALFCLWAALRFVERTHPKRWLLVYALTAALGMYTLYYFAFWLIGVNLVILWLLWRSEDGQIRSRIIAWAGAQLAALLLFLPWLPIFVRQTIDPPVPPWRTPWTSPTEFLASLTETLAALMVGQSPPGRLLWPWAAGVVALIVVSATLMHRQNAKQRRGFVVVSAVVFLPILQIYVLTAAATPLYHIRYIFLYAPLFLAIPAFLLLWLGRRRHRLGLIGLVGWQAAALTGAVAFWSDPFYRADDHRGAVAALATQWRPGDVILVNAGWVYPILLTYWPDVILGVEGSIPLNLSDLFAIYDYTKFNAPPSLPTVVRTGSVDGTPSLGWGDPASDFFAISTEETLTALAALASTGQRIWHYRLYDTVSDPDGLIRQWLEENLLLLAETPIPGRDFGLIQLFATQNFTQSPTPPEEAPPSSSNLCFDDMLCLLDYTKNTEGESGAFFYLTTHWRSLVDPLPALALSLRLYDRQGRLAAQVDAPFLPSTTTWHAGEVWSQPLALPIGVSTKPGPYSLEMVVYRHDTGAALPVSPAAQSIDGQRLQLGAVTLKLPSKIPVLPEPIATFDYIDLIEAHFDRPLVRPGETLHGVFFWRPQPGDYQDNYQVALHLLDERGENIQEWRFPLGGEEYPSGLWPAQFPVRDVYDLPVSDALAPGRYTLAVALHRASDNLQIHARRGWTPLRRVVVAEAEVVSSE
ncbi:MAG: glycosyltransferase family 39 protein [Caldilinea sp.]|nr:glycosyltransferase family 39 protein [Caldilinea sp.]MDW8441191.1 glycosyltransferase family 39 protein [Caldilineaceae bacterium]